MSLSLEREDICLLRETFRQATAKDDFAAAFYDNLFAVDPRLASHFDKVDMQAQGAMITQVVALVLEHLERFEQAHPIIESLGFRHMNYGVKPAHYAAAVEAFMRSMNALAGGLTPRADDVWRRMLSAIVQVMTEGGQRTSERFRSRIEAYAHKPHHEFVDPYVLQFLPNETGENEPLDSDVLAASASQTIHVHYVSDGVAQGAPLQTLLDISLANGIPHRFICGATGRCSTCRVYVLEGLENCLPRNQIEKQLAAIKGFPPNLRLACQTRMTGPARVKRLVRDAIDAMDAEQFSSEQPGREMMLAIMFADIVNFTSFCESNLPYDVVHALNRFFDSAGAVIDSFGGFIDKYIGDGLMAVFGLKAERRTRACEDAVAAALGMVSEVERLNTYLRSCLNHEFMIGVGVAYGPAIVGNVGFRRRRQFTALGDVVNVAARLEHEAKRSGHRILVSQEVRDAVKADEFAFGAPLTLSLRGKSHVQRAFPLTGFAS